MSKILITGGAGFIGSHLQDKLIKLKHQVVVIDDLSSGSRKNINPAAKFYKIKVQDKKIKAIFIKEKPNFVFHLAAQMSVHRSMQDPIFDATVNILGSLNILQNSIDSKIKKIIFFSTGGAMYNDQVSFPTQESQTRAPLSPYGIAKLAVENYLQFFNLKYKLPYAVIAPANVYGPRQNHLGEAGVISIFCNKLIHHQPLILNGGDQTRDFVYVEDVVSLAIKLMSPKAKGVYHVSTAKETSIKDILNKLVKISLTQPTIKYKSFIKGEVKRSCLSYARAKREFGWQPKYKIDSGLLDTYTWFKNN